jgi:hypothetical protein
MKTLLSLIVVALVAQNAAAECAGTACTGRVARLRVNKTGNVSVRMNVSMTALQCTLAGTNWATLRADHPERDQVYALLLAAHMAKVPNAAINIVQGSADCEIQSVASEW